MAYDKPGISVFAFLVTLMLLGISLEIWSPHWTVVIAGWLLLALGCVGLALMYGITILTLIVVGYRRLRRKSD